MAGGDNQNQIPEGGGFSTLVVGDDSMQSLAHVLDDNVTVFNEGRIDFTTNNLYS